MATLCVTMPPDPEPRATANPTLSGARANVRPGGIPARRARRRGRGVSGTNMATLRVTLPPDPEPRATADPTLSGARANVRPGGTVPLMAGPWDSRNKHGHASRDHATRRFGVSVEAWHEIGY